MKIDEYISSKVNYCKVKGHFLQLSSMAVYNVQPCWNVLNGLSQFYIHLDVARLSDGQFCSSTAQW